MVYIIGMIAVVLGVALDQYTKHLATIYLDGNPISIIDGVFQLKLLPGGNDGGAWGILGGHMWLLITISVIASIAISIIYIRLPRTKKFTLLRVCLIFILAGAIGNMIDRICYGSVVDFFDFYLINFPIFNVADIFASVATVGLMFLLLFYYKEEDMHEIFRMISWKRKKENEQEQ